MRRQIDYLILCPLETELNALIKALENHRNFSLLERNNKIEAMFEVKNKHDLEFLICVKLLNKQGNIFSSATTTEILNLQYSSNKVISFGIAGTLNKEELHIGDVIIPTQVVYYEFWREDIKGKKERAYTFSCNVNQDVIQSVISEETDINIVKDYQLASGEKLIDNINSEIRTRLEKMNQNIIAVEMEAAGVAAAIEMGINDCKFIAIKGISDLADGTKNKETAKKIKGNQALAAKNAAAVTISYINSDIDFSKPIRFIPRRDYNIEMAIKKSRKFIELVENGPIDKINSQVALDKSHSCAKNFTPPLFYHWKQSDTNIHFIDFLYIIFLKFLGKHGYPFELLVSDKEGLRPQQKSVLTEKIKKLSGKEPFFRSECSAKYEPELADYTKSMSFFNFYSDTIDELVKNEHALSDTSFQNTVLRFWLRYIALRSEKEYGSNSAIVLCWTRHINIYKTIFEMNLDFNVTLIECPDISIDDKPLKLDNEAFSSFFIDPDSPDTLIEFVKNLDTLLLDELKKLLESYENIFTGDPEKTIYNTLIGLINGRNGK